VTSIFVNVIVRKMLLRDADSGYSTELLPVPHEITQYC